MPRILRISIVILAISLTDTVASAQWGWGWGWGRLAPPPPWGRSYNGAFVPFMANGRHWSPMQGVHPFNTPGNRFGVGGSYLNNRGSQIQSSSGGASGFRGGHFSSNGSGQVVVAPRVAGLGAIDPVGPRRGNETPRQAANNSDPETREENFRALNQPLHWPAFWNAWYHGHWPIPSSKAVDEWLAQWRGHPWHEWIAHVAEDGPAVWVTGATYFSGGLEPYANPYLGGTPEAILKSTGPVDTAAFLTRDREPHTLAFGPLFQALEDIRNGAYANALARIDTILAADRGNVAIHELRALALFGMKRYDEAAATVYAVLSVAPGWDWTTLIFCFGKLDDYNRAMDDLRAAVKASPQAAAPRFLLAYHYLVQGHTDAARRQFQRVVEREPGDEVSRLLVDLLPDPNHEPVASPSATLALERTTDSRTLSGSEEETEDSELARAHAEELVRQATPYLGLWGARGANGSSVSVELQSNLSFRWQNSSDASTFVSDGRFEISGDLIAFQFATGALLVARIVPTGDGEVVFVPLRAPPGYEGLKFSK